MKPVTTAQYLPNKTINSEPVTVRQLNDGFDRATLTILDDALCIAYAELDPKLELMRVDCLFCGQTKLHLREQPKLGSSDNPT